MGQWPQYMWHFLVTFYLCSLFPSSSPVLVVLPIVVAMDSDKPPLAFPFSTCHTHTHTHTHTLFLSLSPLFLSLGLKLTAISRSELVAAYCPTCVGEAKPENAKVVGANSVRREMPLLAVVEARDEPQRRRYSNASLRPLLTTNLGSNKFLATTLSQWYPPSTMKVFGSSSGFSVQNGETLSVDPSQTKPYFEVTISHS